jgi:hypothetical protein
MKNSRDGKQAPSFSLPQERSQYTRNTFNNNHIHFPNPPYSRIKEYDTSYLTRFPPLSVCLSVCVPPAHLFRSLHHFPIQKTTGSHSQVNLFFFFFLQAIILHSLLRTNPLIFRQTMFRLLLYSYTSVSNAPKQKIQNQKLAPLICCSPKETSSHKQF